MFSRQRRKGIAKKLGVSDAQLGEIAARIGGYLNKHGTAVPAVIDSLRFLIETIEEARERQERAEFAHHFRTPAWRKWEIEVVKLYHQGHGAKRISDAITDRKGPRIPKSTIERFLSKNGITRGR